ncbi:MAG TPA: tetratricopeptide repeat protein [Candidatus Acidoferrales bacterium]|nr:tetratricopeptide repeat protein [Candidatus Acidoferrales bacterium]
MAYNKTKYVESAQRFLNQGKIPQAIGEYQNILKYEPRDQVTLMTVGDLYVRLGETLHAVEYFERLAQVFLSDGFVTKAIAIYKKIAKLAPEETGPLEKLAELYVQQGVMSEARPLYLQLAEVHLKAGRQEQGVGLLQKLLDAEPDNLRIQVRLADLYHAMNRNKDAVETYVSAAERVLGRGDHAEAEKLADKALKLSAKDDGALAIKARAMAAGGKRDDAALLLAKMPGIETGGEASGLLMDQYLRGKDWDQAVRLAMKVYEHDPKSFDMVHRVCMALIEAGEAKRALGITEQIRIPMIDAGDHERITQILDGLAGRLPGNLTPLEWLVETYGRTSDSFRLPDALSQLGDAAVEAGDFEKAKKAYTQLLDRQPDNESARRRLAAAQQGKTHTQAAPHAAEAAHTPPALEPRTAPVVEARAAVPTVDADLDPDTREFITQSLTDVDLFASYGLTQKAISVLESVLVRAPRHTGTLEKLLDLYLGAGDDRQTAELAARLESIYRERGDTKNGDRFAELRRRYQRASGIADEDLAAAAQPKAVEPPPPVVESVTPAPTPAPEAPAAEAEARPADESAVHEVDLSEEWAALTEVKDQAKPEQVPSAPPAAPPPVATAPEAVKLEALFSAELAKPGAAVPAGTPPPAEFELPVEFEAGQEKPAPPKEGSALPKEEPVPSLSVSKEAAPAAEAEPDYELAMEPVAPEVPPAKPVTPAGVPAAPAASAHAGPPPKAPAVSTESFLADLAAELDELGLAPDVVPSPSAGVPVNGPSAAAASPAGDAGPSRVSSGDFNEPLKDVFDEFRAELGEMGTELEDLETHYNLGIAFREMGLLEEAISEFQKVAKENERGRAFRYAMQCCTLLGLSFMDKGQANIAAIWYERALKTPGLDPDSVMALRYDLGVAQETAGDQTAALKSFSQVYAMNIDYRDVADRISTLERSR